MSVSATNSPQINMNETIYEILIRGNISGFLESGHVIYFGNLIPQSLDVLSGGDVPEWLHTAGNIQALKQQLKTATDKIQALEIRNAEVTKRIAQLAPNLPVILDRLLSAGLTAWADRSIANYNLIREPGAGSLTPLVARLYAAAANNEVQTVTSLFGEILLKSQVTPTSQESIAMQAILTGVRFPIELINFNQWI